MNTSRVIALAIMSYGVVIAGLVVLGLYLPTVAKIGAVTLILWTAWQVFRPRR